MTKELATLLVLAQAASDNGKGIHSLSRCLKPALKKKASVGYPAKDFAINKAIMLIAKYHFSDVHFFVTEDQEHRAKYLVYFDVKLSGERLQISFHSFNDSLRRFIKRNANSYTEWDVGYSRGVAAILAKNFKLLECEFEKFD